ncbi:hypothetical protein BCR39DRAFT_491296 [Naematelia encephala]|uniref:FAD-binding FR-type domain-containing protein n=1 Tax=Naematelia encephala TaxID=71784 RepID=A0A1Y2BGW8_9TREE|nr:hypothetical protein BCR39DRAFT_491296 [Naematelia encephala]
MQTTMSKLLLGTSLVVGTGLAYTALRPTPAAGSKMFSSFRLPTSLELESVEQVSHNVKKFRFKLPEGVSAGFPMTSALLAITFPSQSWIPVIRPYTPISSPSTPGYLEFMIKRYPSGKSSEHLHSLRPGSNVLFAGPISGPKYDPKFGHVTLIAGGTGLTPCYQLMRHILKDNPLETNTNANTNNKNSTSLSSSSSSSATQIPTKITLVIGANTIGDILLKSEFDEWEKKYPDRLEIHYCISKPEGGPERPRGGLDKAFLEKTVFEPKSESSAVYLCGPPGMEESLAGKRRKGGVLEDLGFKKDRIFVF